MSDPSTTIPNCRCRFVTSTGEPFDEVLPGDNPFICRVTRSGLVAFRFPPPIENLEFTQGERVGPRKLARMREAVARLRQTEQGRAE